MSLADKYPTIAAHILHHRFREAAVDLIALQDEELDDYLISTCMTMIARGGCHELLNRCFERLVSCVTDGSKVFPGLYLRLLQMMVTPEVLEQCLSLVPAKYEGLRIAIGASIKTYRIPLASQAEFHEVAELFSASAVSPGLAPLDRPGAFWMARLIERNIGPIDRDLLESCPSVSNNLFSSRMDHAPYLNVDVVFLCAGDPSYFFSFAELYIDSVIQFCPLSNGIHFVLLDFSKIQIEQAQVLFAKYTDTIGISFSTMERNDNVDRSFYCIARFYELLRVLRVIRGSAVRYLVITDIDHVFVSPMESIFTVDKSLVLGYVIADYLFPWKRFRANLLLINLSCDVVDGLEVAINILRQNLTMILTGKTFWFIDQASIAVMLQILVHATNQCLTVEDITKRYLKTSFQPTGDRFDAKRKLRRLQERGLC